jgi:O-antigen ligase
VSIDAASTLTTLGLFAAFALLLVGLASAGTCRLDRVISALVLFGVAMAVLGVIQRSLTPADESLVYGFWRSIDKGDPFGPFINRNHFAGWMIMAIALAMGFSLAVLERARRPRNATAGDWARWLVTPEASRFAFIVFAVLAMATALVLTRSRSGLAGFLVAVLVLVVAMARRASGSVKRGLVVAYGVALAGGAVLWAGLSTVVTRFSTVAVDLPTRVSGWRDTLQVIQDFPWFGTGFGNYAKAMLVYQTANRSTMFAQAHNDYLQIAAEGGLLVALPALAAALALAAGVRRRFAERLDDAYTYWIRVGAVAALAGMAMQSLVEFSLQMPGNALLFVIAAAVALQRPFRPSTHAHRV